MHNAEQISPPHSLSAEQAVLGGLMLDNDRWDDIATIVSADRFYSRPHSVIFSAMQTLLLQNKPVDLITLAESMEQQGTLEQCGGFAYLAELSKNTPSAANIVAYAEYVEGRLSWPTAVIERLNTPDRDMLEQQLNALPGELEQRILDDLAGRMKATEVRNVTAYLLANLKRAREGQFNTGDVGVVHQPAKQTLDITPLSSTKKGGKCARREFVSDVMAKLRVSYFSS